MTRNSEVINLFQIFIVSAIFSGCERTVCVFAIGFVLIFSETAFPQTIAFSYKGNNRDCIVHLPPSYNASVSYPLVFNLHGYGSNASQQQFYSAMDAVADTAGFIVAYPNAISGQWDVIFSGSPIDDVGFINILLDSLIARYNIDTTRVYATGMSMGGFMTYRLGCEMADRLAAIASVAGPTTDSVLISCNNSRMIPVMHIHGTADNTVPYAGDTLFNNVDSTINFFVRKNGCSATVVNNLANTNTTDGCTITSYHYCMGQDTSEVLFYKVIGGGHTWPGALIPIGVTNHDINGSSEIWKFFKRHQRLKVVSDVLDAVFNKSLRVLPNPAGDYLQIIMPGNDVHKEQVIQVVDMTGRICYSQHRPEQSTIVINLHEFPNGLYSVRTISASEVHQSVIVVNHLPLK